MFLALSAAGLGTASAEAMRHPEPGTSLVRFARVDDGVYKGSKPKSEADFRFLQDHHIRYILQLNFLPGLSGAEKSMARRHGMKLVSVRISASPFPPLEEHVNRALCILRDQRYHPIYLHCDIGRDRTGLIVGLYDLYYKGVSHREAWRLMKEDGFKDSWTLYGLKKYFESHARFGIHTAICDETVP